MDKNTTQSHHSRIYDNFLMHWKYIKREKVGGKWKYTYKDDKDDKYNLSMARGRVANAKNMVERQQKRFDEVHDKVKSGEYFDKDHGNYSISAPYYKDVMDAKRELSAAERNLKKAEEAYSKTPSAKIEAAKEKIDKATGASGDKLDAAVEKAVDKVNNAANKIEDKLGIDERKKYKSAETKYKVAKNNKDTAELIADEELRTFRESATTDWTRNDSERLQRSLSNSQFWRETVEKRGKEYAKAKSEYMKTPLGTALKATEAIKDIPFEVEYALKKLMKKKK